MTFEGIVGSSYTGDLAIDDVSISSGSCQRNTTPPKSSTTSIFTTSLSSEPSMFSPSTNELLLPSETSTVSHSTKEPSFSSKPSMFSPSTNELLLPSEISTFGHSTKEPSFSSETSTIRPSPSPSKRSSISKTPLSLSILSGIVYLPSDLFS